MKIKKLLKPTCICSIVLLLASGCTETSKTVAEDKNQKLIAQRLDETGASEKNVTITKLTLGDKGFSTLAEAINKTELKDILNNEGPYTIFAPVNLAFEKLPEASIKKILESGNEQQLTDILNYHIIPSEINEADIKQAIMEYRGSVKLKTLGGKKLTASLKNNRIFLIDEMGNGGTLITTDVKASNGIMHTVDVVMRPNPNK